MSENIRDAFPPEPWYIKWNVFRDLLWIAVLLYFCSYVIKAPDPYYGNKAFAENVTSADSAFEVYKLHRSKDPPFSHLLLYARMLMTVLHFICYYIGLYASLVLPAVVTYGLCYRAVFMKRRMRAIARFCDIDYTLISEMNIDKSRYLCHQKRREMSEEEKALRSRLNRIPVMCGDLRHPDLILSASKTLPASDFVCLQSVYCDSRTRKFFDFADMVLFMRQMLDAVQYLHNEHIYHLNLQTKNVWVRRSLWRFRRTAKVGGFEFARRSDTNKFYFDEVGLPPAFRTPEYVAGTEMDAEKFDSWSLGVIAFEVFTGGMLSIESELMKPPVRNGQELIGPRGLLRNRYFISALESTWNVLRHLYTVELMNTKDATLLYDLYYDEVLIDCAKFVQCLLHRDYELRYKADAAREMPLMRSATMKRKTSKFNPFRYMRRMSDRCVVRPV